MLETANLKTVYLPFGFFRRAPCANCHNDTGMDTNSIIPVQKSARWT